MVRSAEGASRTIPPSFETAAFGGLLRIEGSRLKSFDKLAKLG
jgi:hypothetical protein